jgi:uncharacterized secreted protein with C-terminal beta-propeller domain
MEAAVPSASTFQSSNSFTTTNIQVEGVDEPDIVKTDGTYLYVLSQNKVFLILAFPADQSHIVSKLEYNGTVEGIFVSQDRLAVIRTGYPNVQPDMYYSPEQTILSIYDISDKSKPTIVKEISVQGSYINSRLTAGYIYAIIQQMAVQYGGWENVRVVPPTIQEDGVKEILPASETYYNPTSKAPVNTYTFVLAVRMMDGASNEVSVLTGIGSTIYASLSNIYLTFPENPIFYAHPGVMGLPIASAPSFWGGYGANTTIFRIAVSNGSVKVAATGSIPGQILNQFSMDEYNDYFRVATTSFRTEYDGNSVQVNNVYVLDESLKIVGSLEGLASKENIYAVRFMGDRAYVVTFEKIDPLYAISLDNPNQPKVLNELKMPGFSQYLHPIGNGYLIGVGKDAVQAEQGDFAWYQGLKISLFHADENGNLSEVAKLLIGDRGSDSPALYDHRAFMFDPDRNVMALPVLVAQINKNGYAGTPPPNAYGDPVWQGAYIFQVSTLNGFELVGNITHISQGQPVGESYNFFVSRVVLIGNFVYTISDTTVKVNGMPNMVTVAEIQLQAA